jgi:hypothetical protein
MKRKHAWLLGGFALVASVPSAEAAVLCANSSGALFVRDICKAGLKQVDPASVGLVGPTGPAGPAGPAGISGAYTNFGAGDFQRIEPGTTQTVASVTLPAGNYTLSASVVGNPIGDARFMQCRFLSFGLLEASVALLSLDDRRLPIIGKVSIANEDTSVFLRCQPIDGAWDATGELIAIKVGTLTASE